MQVTDIRIKKLDRQEGALAGFASVTLDDSLVVHDIGIIRPEGKEAFIAMPSRKLPNGTRVDIVHPINSEFRGILSAAVLKAFDELGEDGEE